MKSNYFVDSALVLFYFITHLISFIYKISFDDFNRIELLSSIFSALTNHKLGSKKTKLYNSSNKI